MRRWLLTGLAIGGLLLVLQVVRAYSLLGLVPMEWVYGTIGLLFLLAGLYLGRRWTAPAPAEPAQGEREAASLEVPNPAANAQLLEPLTDREQEVLAGIAAGWSNQEIADRLHIAESTVKTHVNRLLGKLGARRRTEALAKARALGLLA